MANISDQARRRARQAEAAAAAPAPSDPRCQGRERLAAGAAYTDLGLVFSDELGGYLSPSAVSKMFGRLVKTAAVPRITLHQVRHTFATLGLERGIDVVDVSALLGHSSAAITQGVYQHSRPERLRDAVNTISKAIGADS